MEGWIEDHLPPFWGRFLKNGCPGSLAVAPPLPSPLIDGAHAIAPKIAPIAAAFFCWSTVRFDVLRASAPRARGGT